MPMFSPEPTHRGVIFPWHCDHQGHMNVMWYTGKFDEATWHLFSRLGITQAYMREQARGMVAVQQDISYKKELLAGDLIVIRSEVLEMRDKVIRFRHEMRNAETDDVVATAALTGVHMDRRTRKSAPFPAEILAKGRAAVTGPA
jgi:acyl-CoA thioester hydrolase